MTRRQRPRRLPKKSHLRRSASSLVIQRTGSTPHSSGFRLPCISNFWNFLGSLQPLFQRAGREVRLSFALSIFALIVPASLFAERAEDEETILELLRSCDLAVQGKVEEVIPPGPDRVSTARIRIKEWLKGETEEKKLWVAQELRFPSDQPSYHEGKSVLLFLDDIPSYSRWNDYRSKGVAYTAAGNGQGIKELDPKAAGEVTAFLATYQELASFRTQDEKKEYLDFLLQGLGSRVDLVQEASAEALVRLNDLRLLIGKDEKETLDRFLQDKSKSRAARRRLIRTLLAWEGFEESVAKVLAEEPDMRLSILQDLDASGAGKRLDHSALESCLRDPDPRVRTEALGFVSETADPAVNELVGEMAASDSSAEVRARAVTAASKQAGEAGREILLAGPRRFEPARRLHGRRRDEEAGGGSFRQGAWRPSPGRRSPGQVHRHPHARLDGGRGGPCHPRGRLREAHR